MTIRPQMEALLDEAAPDIWKLNNALSALRRGMKGVEDKKALKDLKIAETILSGYVKGHGAK